MEQLVSEVEKLQVTKISKVAFELTHSAPSDILTEYERFQQVCFTTRFRNLPILHQIEIQQIEDKFYFKNFDYMRHILNEYRTIIMNHNDSINYKKIHTFCYMKLKNGNPKAGLSVKAYNENDEDITDLYLRFIGERNKAIKYIMDKSEFDYIYNGILQHSEHEFTERYWCEYFNGNLNYTFLRHCLLLSYIKELLYCYYAIVNVFTFPRMGSL